ncbi:hypothetical protein BBH56_07610 [Spiribacter roseus]|nr:hypothetical protein BBH56_07610 [Spiribacter roseus]
MLKCRGFPPGYRCRRMEAAADAEGKGDRTMAYDYNTDWLGSGTDAFKALMATHEDALAYGQTLSSKPVTYSFYTESERPPYSDYSYVPTGESAQFEAFSQREKDLTQAVFDQVAAFTGLSFEEVAPGEGDVRFGTHNMTMGGYANYPSDYYEYGNNFVSTDLVGRDFAETLIHEIGHSLGLKHPQPYNGGYESAVLPDALDTPLMSVMTYNAIDTSPSYYSPVNTLSFGPLDIHALQQMYGRADDGSGITYRVDESSAAGDSVVSGFSTVSFDLDLSGAEGSDFMWLFGTTGQDKLYLGEVGGRVDADLESGRISIGETETLGSVYDWASGTKNSAAFGEVGNIRLAPDTDEAAHGVEHVVFTEHTDIVNLGDLASTIELRGGDDRVSGFAGGVDLDAGLGEDVWRPGISYQDSEARQSESGLTLTSNGSTVDFSGFSEVAFSDDRLVIGPSGDSLEAQAYRIYKAAFDRLPDLEGLGFWVNALESGVGVDEVAAEFVASDEMAEKYGASLTDRAYVDALYNNVLGRSPDDDGFEFWLNAIENNPAVSEESLLVEFAESTENVENVAGIIDEGVMYLEWA